MFLKPIEMGMSGQFQVVMPKSGDCNMSKNCKFITVEISRTNQDPSWVVYHFMRPSGRRVQLSLDSVKIHLVWLFTVTTASATV